MFLEGFDSGKRPWRVSEEGFGGSGLKNAAGSSDYKNKEKVLE